MIVFVRWLLYFSPYLRMGEFILGTLVAQLYVQLQGRKATAVESTLGNAIFIAAVGSVFVISYFAYGPGVAMNVFEKMDMNFALAPSAALLIFFRKQIKEASEELRNRLGGPPGPMGPLPSTDAHLLLRRSRKESTPL